MTAPAPAGQMILTLENPDPRRLARRGDGPGSVAAAVEMVESGRQADQTLVAIGLVSQLPGRTSAELAKATLNVAKLLGFDPREWRYVLGRRLSDGEDRGRGPIVGTEYRFNPSKPWHLVDPTQSRCKTTVRLENKGRHAIRWWPVHHPHVTALRTERRPS